MLCPQLSIDSKDHRLLLTTRIDAPAKEHEKMLEILFETFEFQDVALAPQPLMTLYSYGRVRG